MGNSQARWMVYFMENPNLKWMIWWYPYFRKPPLILPTFSHRKLGSASRDSWDAHFKLWWPQVNIRGHWYWYNEMLCIICVYIYILYAILSINNRIQYQPSMYNGKCWFLMHIIASNQCIFKNQQFLKRFTRFDYPEIGNIKPRPWWAWWRCGFGHTIPQINSDPENSHS